MKRPKQHLYIFILFIALIVTIGCFLLKKWQKGETRRFVRQLGPGLNLGNTLDTHDLHFETSNISDFETYWGNPVTTREMIQDIKAGGFDVLRLPITWYEHMDEDGLIEAAWMGRVKEVVDYGLEAGLYVIINAHHDSWYTPDDQHLPRAYEITSRLWGQIAEGFKDYDHRLLFESMNEPRLIGHPKEWGEGTQRAREIINELNQVFVETIRTSGGANTSRYLVLPTYCARTDKAILEDFKLPAGEGLIVSVHLYAPYDFALNIEGTGQFNPESPADTQEIDETFKDLNRVFIKKGLPVMITEFSAMDKKNQQDRADWAAYIGNQAKKLGITCIWWDAGPGEELGKPYPLYNRYTRKWLFPDLKETLINRRP